MSLSDHLSHHPNAIHLATIWINFCQCHLSILIQLNANEFLSLYCSLFLICRKRKGKKIFIFNQAFGTILKRFNISLKMTDWIVTQKKKKLFINFFLCACFFSLSNFCYNQLGKSEIWISEFNEDRILCSYSAM